MSAVQHSRYRPEVDGLRAIAVLAVLAFHAFPSQVRGGFFGVDVFFVISGFLISGIVLRGLDAGNFSFATFYARRIKRIFPALIAVLTVSLLVGWGLLLSDELRLLSKHAASGAAFVINLVLSREQGYFATSAELQPLLHLWSLGIEEQFYLIWPLVLLLAHRAGGRVLTVIVVVGVASFAMNAERISGLSRAVAFYHPEARFWELLLGAGLAMVGEKRPRWASLELRPVSLELACLAGFVLVLGSIVFIDEGHAFPIGAMGPTVGAVTLIATASKSKFGRAVLANRIMVAIGLISYPLYLWHWPLLAFARVFLQEEPSALARVALLAGAFVLAIATYKLIELPLRSASSARRSTSRLIVIVSCTALASLALVSLLMYRGVIPARLARLDFIVDARADWHGPTVTRADRHPSLGISVHMLRGNSTDTILFVGDSNIEQFYPRAKKLWEDSGRKNTVAFVTAGSCSPVPEIERTSGQCRGFMRDAYKYALEPQVKRIVIGATWDYFWQPSYEYDGETPIRDASGPRIFSAYADQLRKLTKAGRRIYLILPVPKGPAFDPMSMLDLASRLSGTALTLRPMLEAPFVAHYATVTQLLRKTAESAHAEVLDPAADLCHGGLCSTATADGKPISKDAGHLRAGFVATSMWFLDAVFSGMP